MFGSWKCKGKALALPPLAFWPRNQEDDEEARSDLEDSDLVLSEIDSEDFSSFIKRQNVWPAVSDVSQAKDLPSWMKTTSLHRLKSTPPLPHQASPKPQNTVESCPNFCCRLKFF